MKQRMKVITDRAKSFCNYVIVMVQYIHIGLISGK